MTQLVIVTNVDNEEAKQITVGVIGAFYVIVSVIQYVYHIIRHYRAHKEGIKDNDNLERCKFVAMCFLNFFFVLASILCFSGDNLHIFGEQNEVGIASVSLLFIGLVGFRLIPAIKDEIHNLFKDNKDPVEDDEEWKPWNTTVDILQLAPEIDGWFTHFAALVFIEQTSSCSAILFICIFIIILALLPVFFAIGHLKMTEERDCAKWCRLLLYIFMFIIVALSLIGDNSQPLDCWNSNNCSFENNSTFLIDGNSSNNFTFMNNTQSFDCNENKATNVVRIIFSAFTFIIYSALLIAGIPVVHGLFKKIKDWIDLRRGKVVAL